MIEASSKLQQDELDGSAGMVSGPARSDSAHEIGRSKQILQEAIDTLEQAMKLLGERSASLASSLRDQARGVLGQTAGAAKSAVGRIEPVVRDEPYLTLCLAAAIGFGLGAALSRPAPKVIYLRERS